MFLSNNYKEDEYTEESYSYDEEEQQNQSFNFNDDEILNNLDNNQMPTVQKAKATTMKKKKKPVKLFDIGDEVVYRKKSAFVVFGPFEKNYKQVYELQMEDGSVVSAISDSIKKK